MPVKKNLVRSNSKEVVEKNKRHILSFFEPKSAGYGTREEQFVGEVDALKRFQYTGTNKKVYPTTEAAIKEMVEGACIGDPYTYDRAKHLNKIGLKKYDADKDDFDEYATPVNELYGNLMVRDGTKLYDEIKNGKKPVKKKTSKGTSGKSTKCDKCQNCTGKCR